VLGDAPEACAVFDRREALRILLTPERSTVISS
jgi:hypothetical protein